MLKYSGIDMNMPQKEIEHLREGTLDFTYLDLYSELWFGNAETAALMIEQLEKKGSVDWPTLEGESEHNGWTLLDYALFWVLTRKEMISVAEKLIALKVPVTSNIYLRHLESVEAKIREDGRLLSQGEFPLVYKACGYSLDKSREKHKQSEELCLKARSLFDRTQKKESFLSWGLFNFFGSAQEASSQEADSQGKVGAYQSSFEIGSSKKF